MNFRSLYISLILGVCWTSVLQGQISGVINRYTEVFQVDFCNNLAVVSSASGYGVGDHVMLVQMQGAIIDSTDSPTYGVITDSGTSGKYELLTIREVISNIIIFEEAMLNEYEGKGIQLVRVPEYGNETVNGTLTSAPWDGFTGGVLALICNGILTMNADIDASGTGFRGAATNNVAACTAGGSGYSGYRCDLASGCGGFKGEGIGFISAEPLGRGAPANAGGGGNDHNTGGGGGASFGTGGLGGTRANTATGDCLGNDPGLGANPIFFSNGENRVYMGGGGGAGDGNDNEATMGANGGGIILLQVNILEGNGFAIRSNGDDAAQSGQDGAGGGGAAGLILLDLGVLITPAVVELQGGNGGDVDNANDPTICMGPGGGGGGGIFWHNGAAAPMPFDASAGIAGITVNANAPAACAGSSNGATLGTAGASLNSLVIPVSTIIFEPLAITLSPDSVLCFGDTTTIGVPTAMGTGTLNFDWNTGDTTQFIEISPTNTTTTFSVTVTDSRGCGIVRIITIAVTRPITASKTPELILSPGQTVTLIAEDDPLWTSYSWSPPTSLSSTTGSIVDANPFESITYCVTAVDTIGCVTEACVDVLVDARVNLPNAFTPNNDGLNDLFGVPLTAPCQELQVFEVYNRWGTKIFDYAQNTIGWDGTYMGKEQEAGSYIFRIVVICEGEVEKEFNGTITLLR